MRVGINFLEKIQLATPAAAYGALLAGVDVVLVGAGIPARLPALLDHLSVHEKVEFPVDVAGAGQSRHAISFDPVAVLGRALGAVVRPLFLAIVSSNALATYLARDKQTRPDGFVVEGGIAGGHNAPPAGPCSSTGAGIPSTARVTSPTPPDSPSWDCLSGWQAATRDPTGSPRQSASARAASRWARSSR